MRTQVRKCFYGRKSLLALSVAAALVSVPASATLVDSPLTISPATALTVGGVTLPEAFQQAGDLTGLSVATDGQTLVIGAPQMAGANRNSFGANLLTTSPINPTIAQATGKVYVYQRDVNSNWIQKATLMASVRADKDGFGVSVAVDGNTIVVGADGALGKQGQVYIFEKPAIGGWSNLSIMTETAELLPLIPDPLGIAAPAPLNAANAYFGHAVAIKGGAVVVGQWGGVPASYIFERPVAGWGSLLIHNQTATLQPLIGGNPVAIPPVIGTSPSQLGMSVAVDIDAATGLETVVVGGQDTASGAAGAVYVFEQPTLAAGGWGSLLPNADATAILTPSLVAQALDGGQDGTTSFGFDVDIKGNTIVVGAVRFDASLPLGVALKDSGAVFVFEKPALGGWMSAPETLMLTAPTPTAFQEFGRSVSVTNDRILVGTFTNPALRADPIVGGFGLVGNALAPTALNAPQGRAYIFDKPVGVGSSWATYNAALTPPALWQSPVGSIDDMFGYSVAAANTTYVAGGFALDTDLAAPGSLPGAAPDGIIDNNVGSAAVKEATVILNITNSLPAGTIPAVGDVLTYTIVVANNDPVDTATNVVVMDSLLASGFSNVQITSPTTGCTLTPVAADPIAIPPIPASTDVNCNLGDILPNSSVTITLTATVVDPASIDHSASVTASESLNPASNSSSSVNVAPTAVADAGAGAGLTQNVDEGILVTLDGTASSDTAPGTIASYAWVQTSGDSMTLTNANTATATFTAPTLTASSILPLSFKLMVTDGGGIAATPVTATASVDVTVNDISAPIITVPLDISFEATAVKTPLTEANFGTATATDASAFTITSDAPAAFPVGDTTVTWTATENRPGGLVSTATQVVTVVDTTNPTITAPANVTAEAEGANTAASSISLGSPVTSDIFSVTTVNDAPTTFPVGDTTVTWTATDANGLSSTATQIVTVQDTKAPSMSLSVNLPVEATGVNTPVSLVAPSAADLFLAGSPTSDAQINFPNGFPVGTHTVTWTATDTNGNSSTKPQTITVKDTLAPTLTLTGGDTLIQVGDTFNAPSATATDLVSGTVAVTDDRVTNLNTVVGTHKITFTAVDGAGNTVTKVHTVVVNGLPVINSVPTATVVAGQSYSYDLNATDANGDDLTYSFFANQPSWLSLDASGVLTGSPTAADKGSYQGIIITVSDGNGGSTNVGPFNVEVTAVPAASTGGGGGGGSLPLSLLAILLGLGLRRRATK